MAPTQRSPHSPVIPAQAGIQGTLKSEMARERTCELHCVAVWIPACAGMTMDYARRTAIVRHYCPARIIGVLQISILLWVVDIGHHLRGTEIAFFSAFCNCELA